MAKCRRDVVYSVAPGFRPLSLDLFVGDNDAAAMCVFLHGGGWRIGSRREGTPVPSPLTLAGSSTRWPIAVSPWPASTTA
jgi:acetyl esterase/lipase